MASDETIIIDRLAHIVAREKMRPEPDKEKVLVVQLFGAAIERMAEWDFSRPKTLAFVAIELRALDLVTPPR